MWEPTSCFLFEPWTLNASFSATSAKKKNKKNSTSGPPSVTHVPKYMLHLLHFCSLVLNYIYYFLPLLFLSPHFKYRCYTFTSLHSFSDFSCFAKYLWQDNHLFLMYVFCLNEVFPLEFSRSDKIIISTKCGLFYWKSSDDIF